MREIRLRTRNVGAFPDDKSALMLAAVRLRHIAGTQQGMKRYLKMDLLQNLDRPRPPWRKLRIGTMAKQMCE